MLAHAPSSLMAYEDQLRSHPQYFRAALAAIDIYTRIADDPSLTVETSCKFTCPQKGTC